MMQKPIQLFKILSTNTTRNENKWKHKDLYRQLYNVDLFALAYQKIYANKGSMTEGTDRKTVDGMSIDAINAIIEELKTEKYQPKPVQRVYIPKKNGKKRPLGIPTFKDRLIQESIRLILESIYEPIFSDDSHGYRPNKSCHTALNDIKRKSNGMIWWIEGDIKGFFDNINHNILIDILRKKIDDERFLRLIRKFLKSGFLENWKYNNTYSGTPQGGIISPMLANIYLNEFDQWVKLKKEEFDLGKNRKRNVDYNKFSSKLDNIKAKINTVDSKNLTEKEKFKRQSLIEEYKNLKKIRNDLGIRPLDYMDKDFKRLIYVRYADDWVIGIIGSKNDTYNLKEEINKYFHDKLKLELSEEKTLITHGDKGFKFLGYYVGKADNKHVITNNKGIKTRHMSSKYKLLMPHRKEFEYLLENGFAEQINGEWKPKAVKQLFTCDDLEIVSYYNASFRGIYNYYRLADNVSKLQTARWLWKLSWGKTMANKYRTQKAKIFRKYQIGKRIGVRYETKKGENICYLLDIPLRKDARKVIVDDTKPTKGNTFGRTSLMDRLKARECELCGKIDVPLQMHHVKRIKELKSRKHLTQAELFMVSRNRKQIALCEDCHTRVHAND